MVLTGNLSFLVTAVRGNLIMVVGGGSLVMSVSHKQEIRSGRLGRHMGRQYRGGGL